MKVCAIIAEFNPFHDGHKYLINKALEITKCDILLVIMSGNYVQRGECSIFNKYFRAEKAAHYGADIIIELPPYYSVNNASKFAYYSTKIINLIKSVNYICFGSEIDDLNLISKLSNYALDFKNHVSTSNFTNSRNSYFMEKLGYRENIFNCSNLILAIEYLKYLRKDITPIPIKRQGNNYNDISLSAAFNSASAIRKAIFDNKILPESKPAFMENYFNIIKYNFVTTTTKSALHNRIKKNLSISNNYNELIINSYAKNISKSTIKRYILREILGLNNFSIDDVYSNVLYFNEKSKILFGELPNTIIRTSDAENLNDALYNLFIHHKKIDELYTTLL